MSRDAEDREPPSPLTRSVGWPTALAAGFLLTVFVLLLLLGLVQLWPAEPGIQPLDSTNARFLGWEGALAGQERLALLVGIAGALGGGVYCLRSLAWYVGNRQLYLSWLFSYALVPVVGAVLGILSYFLILGAIPAFLPTLPQNQALNPFGFVAVASLFGLFSQQVLGFLNRIFGEIFSRAETPVDQSALTKAVGRSVSQAADEVFPAAIQSSLRQAVLGPPLANFTGVIDIQTSIGQEAPGSLPESRVLVATPGSVLFLLLTIRQGDDSDSGIPLRITNGEDVGTVEFAVALDTDLGVQLPQAETISLGPRSREGRCTFRIPVPESYDTGWVWVRVAQRQRTVQSIELQLRSQEEPS